MSADWRSGAGSTPHNAASFSAADSRPENEDKLRLHSK